MVSRRWRRYFWRRHLESRMFAPDPEDNYDVQQTPSSRLPAIVAATLLGICVLGIVAGIVVLVNLPQVK